MACLRDLLAEMEKATTMAQMNRLLKAFTEEAFRLGNENLRLREENARLKMDR